MNCARQQHFSNWDVERIRHQIKTGRIVDPETLAAINEHVVVACANELDDMQSDLDAVQGDLKDAESERDSAQTNAEDIEGELDALKERVAGARAILEASQADVAVQAIAALRGGA